MDAIPKIPIKCVHAPAVPKFVSIFKKKEKLFFVLIILFLSIFSLQKNGFLNILEGLVELKPYDFKKKRTTFIKFLYYIKMDATLHAYWLRINIKLTTFLLKFLVHVYKR